MSDEPIVCVECGYPVKLHYVPDVNDDLTRRQMCFNDRYWAVQAEHGDGVVTDAWNHYRIEPDTGPNSVRGFGGRTWVVRFKDGRGIVTSNLWHQGEIPDHWRDRFSPNASLETK